MKSEIALSSQYVMQIGHFCRKFDLCFARNDFFEPEKQGDLVLVGT